MKRILDKQLIKKKICLIIIFLLFISCNEKNDKKDDNIKFLANSKTAPYNLTDLGDGSKFNYDTLSTDYIKKVKISIQSRKFKFPDKQKFKDRIFEVFNINIYDFNNKIVVLRPAMFTEIAIKEDRFVLVEDAETDDNAKIINDDFEYYYNSYVFYGNKEALNWLKSHNKENLNNLVIEYGYGSDIDLLRFVLKDLDFENKTLFKQLIFDNNNKLKIREDILDGILVVNYGGKSEDLSYAKDGNGFLLIGDIINEIRSNPNSYSNPNRTIAILLNKDLEVGVVGNAEAYLHENPDYKTFLKKNKYFNLQRLKEYVEYLLDQNPKSDYESVYEINDSDGYTNLRKAKNSTSDIIEKVKSGEKIEVLDDSGNWWLIQTQSGNKGYVYKTKIK